MGSAVLGIAGCGRKWKVSFRRNVARCVGVRAMEGEDGQGIESFCPLIVYLRFHSQVMLCNVLDECVVIIHGRGLPTVIS